LVKVYLYFINNLFPNEISDQLNKKQKQKEIRLQENSNTIKYHAQKQKAMM
jgi:hypothetical protein